MCLQSAQQCGLDFIIQLFFGPLEPKEMSYGGENEYNAGEVSVKDRDDGLTPSWGISVRCLTITHCLYWYYPEPFTFSGPTHHSWAKCDKLWGIRCRCYTKWCVITINMLLNADVMDIFRRKKINSISPSGVSHHFLKRSDQKTKKYSHRLLENTIKFGQRCQ